MNIDGGKTVRAGRSLALAVLLMSCGSEDPLIMWNDPSGGFAVAFPNAPEKIEIAEPKLTFYSAAYRDEYLFLAGAIPITRIDKPRDDQRALAEIRDRTLANEQAKNAHTTPVSVGKLVGIDVQFDTHSGGADGRYLQRFALSADGSTVFTARCGDLRRGGMRACHEFAHSLVIR